MPTRPIIATGAGSLPLVTLGLVVALLASVTAPGEAQVRAAAMEQGNFDRLACPQTEVPSGGFADTAKTIHRATIDCLVWWGVTGGTSADRYSPGQALTRAQIATLLAEILELSGREVVPPVANEANLPPSPFSDTTRSPHRHSITALASMGIVGGTSGDRYSPNVALTRAQMASMLVTLYEDIFNGHVVEADTGLSDIGGSPHASNIRKLVALGVTQGVTPTTFEPGSPVRRDQVATFLTRYLSVLVHRGIVDPRPRAGALDPAVLPDVPDLTIRTYGTVTQDQIDRLKLGMNVTYHEIGSPGPVVAHLFNPEDADREAVIDAFVDALAQPEERDRPEFRDRVWGWLAGGAGIAGLGVVYINVLVTDAVRDFGNKNLNQTMIHEFAHTIHHRFNGHLPPAPPDDIPLYGPEWLSEGSAEQAGYVIGARYGWIDLPFAWRRPLWWARQTDAPLEDMAPRQGIDDEVVDVGYGQSAIAAMLLGDIAGEAALLRDYWLLLGQGLPWEQAFERAFGMTVGRYYGVFADYKATHVPGPLPRTTVDRPDDRAGPNVKFLYLVPSDGEDRRFDVDGSVATLARDLRQWIADQSDGQWLKLDTYLGEPDVAFLRTSHTEQEVYDAGGYDAPILLLDDVHAAGFDDPETIYVSIYDGGLDGICTAGRTADRRVIHLPVLKRPVGGGCSPADATFSFVPGRNDSFVIYVMTKLVESLHFELDCYTPFPPDGRIPNYEYPQHELRHFEMLQSDVPVEIDPLRTRYWGHGRDDCTDISKSQFLSQPLGR